LRLTVDEYCKHFKMSKEMIHSKIKAKRLNYIIENGETFVIVTRSSLEKNKRDEINEEKKITTQTQSQIIRPKTTVATVLALYQKENNFLKEKIVQLETKIDKLIDDKEQMLRDERDKIEEVYSSKDQQLKNILELINNKISLEKEQTRVHEIESFKYNSESEIVYDSQIVELKDYLKSLGIKASKRRSIKNRFLDVYDSDIRIINQNGKLYLDFSKYDYSDLLA